MDATQVDLFQEGEEPTLEEGQEQQEQQETANVEEGEARPEGEGGEGEVAQQVKPYTDDEVVKILEESGKLDSRRLTPTQKLIQTSFARHANKGYQEIAEMKRTLQAQQEAIRATQAPPRTIEEAYVRDPRGVLAFIDQSIANIQAEAEKDPINAIKQLGNLQATRNRLTDMNIQTAESRRIASETAHAALQDVAEAIPDFGPEKQQKLTEFAVEELGYSVDDLASMTHPSKGRMAAQAVKTINAAYEAKYGKRETAAMNAASKKVNRKPIVEGASTSQNTQVQGTNLARALADAKKTGDWTKYLDMKGVLDRIVSK